METSLARWMPYLLLPALVTLVIISTAAAASAQGGSMPGMDMPTPPGATAPASPSTPSPDTPSASTTPRTVPVSVIAAAVILAILLVLFVLAEMRHWTRPRPAILGGLALLVAVYGAASYVVHLKKDPGQTTVWQSATMDMSAMKPIPGAAPVSIEMAESGPFTASVVYTGTVVAFSDEDIYPRVTGRVVAMPVYTGDEVRPGQLLARLDDEELQGREREATAAARAARENARAAGEEVSAAESARRQKASAAQAVAVGIAEAGRMAEAAGAKHAEAQKAVVEARRVANVANREQSMAAARITAARSEADAAQAAVDAATADLAAATADLTYWEAEVGRTRTLLDKGAASLDEYQTEEARYKTAAATVGQKRAMVTQSKSMLAGALARVHEAEADGERAAAQVAAAEATADRVAAGVATAEAELQAARTRVEQARASARAAAEEVGSGAAEVRAKAAQQRAMGAMSTQAAAALSVARTVRGYTEIRATSPARVLQRVVSPGTLVAPGTLLLRLAQVDRVRLQAPVDAADLQSIRVGSRVWVGEPGHPGGQTVARVTSISPSSDPASRTSIVEALVANPRRQLLPGQAVRMQIETLSVKDAVTVPDSAIVPRQVSTTDDGGKQSYSVWTVTTEDTAATTIYTCPMHPQIQEKEPGNCPICGMKLVPKQTGGRRLAHLVDVTVGPSDGQRTQVLSGIVAGQEIITRGIDGLQEGQAVETVPYGPHGPLQLPMPAGGPVSPATGGSGMDNMPGMSHGGHGG